MSQTSQQLCLGAECLTARRTGMYACTYKHIWPYIKQGCLGTYQGLCHQAGLDCLLATADAA